MGGEVAAIMSAHVLTQETAAAYVAQRAEAIGVFAADASLTANEIHGGNLNYAFQVTDGNHSVFVKQAPDYIKCFGPEAKLHRERMELEVRVFGDWAQVLGAQSAQFLPAIFHFDVDAMVFVMEFLEDGYLLLDGVLDSNGRIGDAVWSSIGTFMALTHARTHSTQVPAARADGLHTAYANTVLRGIQLNYVFTKCFADPANPATESNALGVALGQDQPFMLEIESLKRAYSGEQADNRALCHGDLHPGSLMINAAQGHAKIIDPEFCIYGPPGVDLGSLLSGVILLVVSKQFSPQPDAAAIERLITAVDTIWLTYSTALEGEGVAAAVIKQISEDTIGFACAEVARTSLGFAGIRGLAIEDAARKATAQQLTLNLVRRCILGRRGATTATMEILTNDLRNLGHQAVTV